MRIYFLSFLWVLPFICFLGGYHLIRLLSDHGSIEAPAVVGQHIHDAIKLLSHHHLNARILTEKEDAHLPEGIVINQSPVAGNKIKSHQSVFLVVTRKPPKPQALKLYGMSLDDAHAVANSKAIQVKSYGIESVSPQDTCIAQDVQPSQELDGPMTAYFSEGTTPIRLVPLFKGKKALEVQTLLKDYGIAVKVVHTKELEEGHSCQSCIVLGQHPVAGSLVNIKRPLTIHLTVGI